jgi:peroxiredoxin
MTGRIVRTFLAAVALVVATGCGSGDDRAYAVTDLETGDTVSLDDLAGAPAVLVSWATWCRECDEELASLQAFAESPAADGVTVVAVNLDAADVDDAIHDKIERHGLTVELWRDRRNEFRRAFGALGVPTTVVLDADGDVVGTFPGGVASDEDALADALRRAGAG